MKIVCAWCGKSIGEKEPLEDKSTTHGICEECLIKNFPHIAEKVAEVEKQEEEPIEEAQARMMRKCRQCPRMVHYMELTTEGLCPVCAEKEQQAGGSSSNPKEPWTCPKCGRLNDYYSYPTLCSRCGYRHTPEAVPEVAISLDPKKVDTAYTWFKANERGMGTWAGIKYFVYSHEVKGLTVAELGKIPYSKREVPPTTWNLPPEYMVAYLRIARGMPKTAAIQEVEAVYIPALQKEAEAKPPAVEGNPSRVHFDRASIDSAIAAAGRLKSDRDLYIFATHLGYTIDGRRPPGMQQYVIVHPDGTTETVKPIIGGNPDAKEPWQRAEIEAVSKKYLSDMEALGPHGSDLEKQALTDKYTAKIKALKQQPQTMKEGYPAPKEPWQMTLEEYSYAEAEKYGHGKPRIEWIKAGYGSAYRSHKTAVERALREGKPVPPEVLAEYPDLRTGGNPIPEELDLARTLAIIDSRPKGRIIESKLREEFGDAVIDALRQGSYVVSGSAGYNPPLLVSLKGRELIQGGNPIPEAKEPWQMTKAEYVRPPYTSPAMHKFGVEKALKEGKSIPPEVLAEYPDLVARYGPGEIRLSGKMVEIPLDASGRAISPEEGNPHYQVCRTLELCHDVDASSKEEAVAIAEDMGDINADTGNIKDWHVKRKGGNPLDEEEIDRIATLVTNKVLAEAKEKLK